MLGDGELISGAFHSLFWLGIVTIHEEFSKYHWNFSLLAYLQTSTIKINTLLLLWALPSSVGGGGGLVTTFNGNIGLNLHDNCSRVVIMEPALNMNTLCLSDHWANLPTRAGGTSNSAYYSREGGGTSTYALCSIHLSPSFRHSIIFYLWSTSIIYLLAY